MIGSFFSYGSRKIKRVSFGGSVEKYQSYLMFFVLSWLVWKFILKGSFKDVGKSFLSFFNGVKSFLSGNGYNPDFEEIVDVDDSGAVPPVDEAQHVDLSKNQIRSLVDQLVNILGGLWSYNGKKLRVLWGGVKTSNDVENLINAFGRKLYSTNFGNFGYNGSQRDLVFILQHELRNDKTDLTDFINSKLKWVGRRI